MRATREPRDIRYPLNGGLLSRKNVCYEGSLCVRCKCDGVFGNVVSIHC